jgi:flagellar motor protein MotB
MIKHGPRKRDQVSHTDDWLMTYADMITLLLCFFAIIILTTVSKNNAQHKTQAAAVVEQTTKSPIVAKEGALEPLPAKQIITERISEAPQQQALSPQLLKNQATSLLPSKPDVVASSSPHDLDAIDVSTNNPADPILTPLARSPVAAVAQSPDPELQNPQTQGLQSIATSPQVADLPDEATISQAPSVSQPQPVITPAPQAVIDPAPLAVVAAMVKAPDAPLLQTPVVFEKKGDRLSTLEMSGATFFASGSATIIPSGISVLEDIATRLQLTPYKDFQITVEGHTDDTPVHTVQFPSNWELSTARASAVVQFFLQHGIDAKRLRAAGYADTFPKVPNHDSSGAPIPANRAENRRVVIRLEKIETN